MPQLTVIPGDGIGQEVIPVAVDVLAAVVPDLELVYAEAGWGAFEQHGASVPQPTLDLLRQTGAGLFGAVSSPSHKVEGYRSAILTMRQELGLYANIRPVQSLPQLSPRGDVDLIVVRENSEGLYSGRERSDGETAVAERVITRAASERLARRTVELMAQFGRKKLTIVHKANVLPLSDGLFRDAVRGVMGDAVAVDELLVDIAALKLVAEPQRFDVIITTNMFGDILSDLSAHWCGGMGIAPSINVGNGIVLAEPVHGSAPDIAGQGVANPIAAILSAALVAEYAWGMVDSAETIRHAVRQVLEAVNPLVSDTKEIGRLIRAQCDRMG